jgi:3-oxoacyl-[acyl-carrier protein] reductase
LKLAGRVALVTGASRGIGRAIALGLAAEGADVAVNFRSRATEAEAVAAEIAALGRRALVVQADVSELGQVEALVERTTTELGGLHILVNNAGTARDGLIANLGADEWLDVMRTNFGGVFNGTRAAMGHLMAQREGSIVNISSVMAERGWIGDSTYSASKAAVNAFTRSSAVELARFGVRVNAVLAGLAPTELVAGLLSRDGGQGVSRQVPMRRFADLEDIARVVVFLAGPDSVYMTGSLVTVDGGISNALGMAAPLK